MFLLHNEPENKKARTFSPGLIICSFRIVRLLYLISKVKIYQARGEAPLDFGETHDSFQASHLHHFLYFIRPV